MPNESLVLISKSNPWVKGPQLILTETLWENDWFKLGRICNEDDCLKNNKSNLSKLLIGDNEFEDSLLTFGWYGYEKDGRWSRGIKSSLRLVSYDEYYNNLVIEAQALALPQSLTVSIDGIEIKTLSLTEDFQIYKFKLPSSFSAGVHHINFSYSHTYKPSLLFGNSDNRNLATRFKQIYFE